MVSYDFQESTHESKLFDIFFCKTVMVRSLIISDIWLCG